MSQKKEKIMDQSLHKILSERFSRYAKYIIQDRALPDARDGLKPVQRRILFAMNDLNLFHNKPFKKSARIVGEVIGKYHPHGDSSIYEAMVRMSQEWKMNMPLISMHGNNGSIDDDPAAAMRYTEVRLSKLTDYLLNGIKKNTVFFAPNFDDSEYEPTVLPAEFPNLLVNGARGIAAGYATEIPPHNLGEVIDASIALIKSPNISLNNLMKYVMGPDFPTGAIVQGFDGIYGAFEKGKGRLLIKSKAEINDSKTKPSINITEIPYGVVKSKLVREIDEIRFNKTINGIKEVRDETDRNKISIMIELKAGTNPHLILNYLYLKTNLQIYYNYNNIAIKDRTPRLLSLKELIQAFVVHTKNIETKKIIYINEKEKNRYQIILGLVKAANILDKVIEVIKKSSGSKAGVVKDLTKNFQFTEIQANAIAELRLYRLSSTDQSIYLKEKEELEIKLKEYKDLLENKDYFDKYIINKLKKLKKEFPTPRKTVIEREIQKVEINAEELIEHKDVWVGITKMGYIKLFLNNSKKANEIKDYGMKEGDSLIFLEQINTAAKILVFTNKGKYVFINTHKIKQAKYKNIGQHVNDFAVIDSSSTIVGALAIADFGLNAFVVLATKLGKIKRMALSKLKISRFSKAVTAIKLSEKDCLVGAKLTNGHMQIVLISSNALANKYSETTIPLQGPQSSGVIGIDLNKNFVTGFAVAANDNVLCLASNRGGIKRIQIKNIKLCQRNKKGNLIYRAIKSKPHLILDAAPADTNTEIIFNVNKGAIITKLAKTANITGTDVGLYLISPNMICTPKITGKDYLNKNSSILTFIHDKNQDEVFSKASAVVKSVEELSIEELLKDF